MKKIIKKQQKIWLVCLVCLFGACNNYLDVVPEGISRLENAFAMRDEAKKYLYTCYSYMPKDGDPASDAGMMGGDDMWTVTTGSTRPFSYDAFDIARGLQNSSTPLNNKWPALYRAIRDCNIFLENVVTVPDLDEWEMKQWVAEAKFLKAYYHFCLLRMYGPVPIVRENLPIDVDVNDVKVVRDPVDTCVDYMVQLLDEAAPDLPLSVVDMSTELGRITRPIALSLKAKVLVTAASPLFNGNTDQATLKNRDGLQLFNQTYMPEKWDKAVAACKDAVDMCVNQLGMTFYTYPGDPRYHLTDTIVQQLTLRNAFCMKWNSEIIWANTQSIVQSLQLQTTPKLDPLYQDYSGVRIAFGIPLKIVEMFYTENGVPIEEDRTWDASKKYSLRKATAAEKLYVVEGELTARMHFEREPRFYAWVAFDQGMWYGQGKFDDRKTNDMFRFLCRMGQRNGLFSPGYGPTTGYLPKKYIHYENVQPSNISYSINRYPWPIMRLSDLFLLYAEALNEAADNAANRALAIEYLNRIRTRAGLPTVEDAWENYSSNPGKYTSQVGLRLIIQRERTIELAFEGHRFWDIRRWKTAVNEYKTPVMGWDLKQSTPSYFYNPQEIFKQRFGVKDYFWPIKNSDITTNPNLVQNIGW